MGMLHRDKHPVPFALALVVPHWRDWGGIQQVYVLEGLRRLRKLECTGAFGVQGDAGRDLGLNLCCETQTH